MEFIDNAKWLAHAALDALIPSRRVLAELRGQWGRPGTKREPFAGRWFELTRDAASCVDDKTWADLEFPRLFTDLDTTVTPLGSQALHRQLREYLDDPAELAARHALHVRLRDDAPLRERLQQALMPLRAPEHAQVVEALFGEPPESPRGRWLPGLAGVCSLALLAAVIGWSWSVWWWLAVLPVNVAILYRHSWRVLREMEQVAGCLRMLGVADRLAGVRAEAVPPLDRLRAEGGQRKLASRALSPLRLCKQEGVNWVVMWLNLAFLLELNVHLWTVGRFFRLRGRLRESFAQVAALDAAIAMASALVLYPRHCRPGLAAVPRLEILEGRHPLLPDGVPNSIRLDGRSLLVTGSNMAGKTTFVKMLAINAILGRSMGFCLARHAVLPSLPVMAAIHGEHAVAAGKSHYFAQIEAIRGFLDGEARHGGGLFVLDEPFSGTNTVERIAIAAAVLGALGERSLVLVTTHDVELQAMLGERYLLCHFQENPEVDGYFDYRLREGAATARNAIRLLARMGFPGDVVAAAMGHAQA